MGIDLRLRRPQVLSELVWVIAGRLGAGIGSLVAVRILTFNLDPNVYSNLLLLVGAVGLLASIASAPISNAVNRYYYEMERQQKRIELMASGWLGLAMVGTLVSPLVFVALPLLGVPQPKPPYHLLTVALLLGTLIVRLGYPSLNIGRHRREAAILTALDAAAAPVVATLFAVYSTPDWEMVVLGYAVGSTIPVLLAVCFLLNRRMLPTWHQFRLASRTMLVQIFRFGWATAPGALSVWVLSISDRYLLNQLVPLKETVAYYAVAYQVGVFLPQLAAGLFTTMVWPYVMDAYIPEERQHPNIEMWLGLFSWIAIPIFPFSIIFADRLIVSLAPESYLVAHAVVPFSCLAMLLYSFEQVTNISYHLCNKVPYSIVLALLAGIANPIMNLLLIPRVGFMGAAYATVLAYGLEFLLAVGYSRRLIFWRMPWRWLLPPIVSAITSTVITASVRASFSDGGWLETVALIVTFGLSYAAVLGLSILAVRDGLCFRLAVRMAE